MFDVYVMLVFGVLGFVLREMKYPMAPLVLGIILGDLVDINLRRGLLLSDGDPTPFFTRPISLVLFLVILRLGRCSASRRSSAASARLLPAARPHRRRIGEALLRRAQIPPQRLCSVHALCIQVCIRTPTR